MDKYLIRKPFVQDSSLVQDSSSSFKWIRVDFNLENIRSDMNLCVFWLWLGFGWFGGFRLWYFFMVFYILFYFNERAVVVVWWVCYELFLLFLFGMVSLYLWVVAVIMVVVARWVVGSCSWLQWIFVGVCFIYTTTIYGASHVWDSHFYGSKIPLHSTFKQLQQQIELVHKKIMYHATNFKIIVL